jgi:polyisoprenoid-binding protein YceI
MAKWVIDIDHAAARFSIRHFMIANVVGLFGRMTGTIYFDPSDIGHLTAEVEIDVRSLTTGNKERDEHLLSPDFLDAAKYPRMTFKTTRMETTGDRRAKSPQI